MIRWRDHDVEKEDDDNVEEADEKDDNVDVAEDEDDKVKGEEDDDVEEEEDVWHDDVEGGGPIPRPGNHTGCEPAQSKCTSTCHKSYLNFIQKFTGKMPGNKT